MWREINRHIELLGDPLEHPVVLLQRVREQLVAGPNQTLQEPKKVNEVDVLGFW